MFDLTFTTAFMLYLGLTLMGVMGVWLFSHYRTRNRTIFQNEQTLYICEFCHHSYVEESIKNVNRCPQCGLMNEKNIYVNPSAYQQNKG